MKILSKNTRNIIGCYMLILKGLPIQTILEGLSYIGNAVIGGIMPIAWKILFDALSAHNDFSLNSFIRPFCIFAVMQFSDITFRLLGRVSGRLMGYGERIAALLEKNLYEHAVKLPLETFENADIYDSFERAENAIKQNTAANFIEILYQVPAMIFSLAVMTAVVWTFSPWLVLATVISILPASVIRIAKGKEFYMMKRFQTQDARKRNYLFNLFTAKESIREMRVYDTSQYIKNKWRLVNEKINNEESDFTKRNILARLPADFIRTAGYGFGIIFSVLLLRYGKITIGSFGAVIGAFNNLQSYYDHILQTVGSVRDQVLFFSDYMDFINTAAEKCGKLRHSGKIASIKARNISYKYPSAGKEALKNVSIEIKNNEKIALLGENGSGKTTLCKILLGLYKPNEGEIYINGINMEEINKKDIRKEFSAAFQDFTQYMLSLRENVGYGDADKLNDDKAVLEALKQAGAQDVYDKLRGLDSYLGREFGGSELSGGQWQKVALSRGIIGSRSLIVFDEPTAALDPLAEDTLLTKLVEANKDRAMIIVSHRIGLARLADRIVVMKDGAIAEQGSHKKLLSLNGEYAKMYNMQAKWYVN